MHRQHGGYRKGAVLRIEFAGIHYCRSTPRPRLWLRHRNERRAPRRARLLISVRSGFS
jgi:hypothetical protein